VSSPEPSRESIVRTEAVMGTLVTIEVLIPRGTGGTSAREAIERALGWFREIERRCTRFDSSSELMQLAARPGEAVAASPMLFEAIRFARLVAEETGGAFDPACGYRMMARGFDREHRSGTPFMSISSQSRMPAGVTSNSIPSAKRSRCAARSFRTLAPSRKDSPSIPPLRN
jgi:thiamine biosynthesis lipoprotein ApbE